MARPNHGRLWFDMAGIQILKETPGSGVSVGRPLGLSGYADWRPAEAFCESRFDKNVHRPRFAASVEAQAGEVMDQSFLARLGAAVEDTSPMVVHLLGTFHRVV